MSTSKRQKLSSICVQQKKTERNESQNECYTLETLPPEVLEMILRLLPLQDVASVVRLVSRHCSMVATTILNGAFLAAGIKLDTIMKHLEETMLRVKTDTELLVCSRTFNVLELIKAQYKMLKAVTWRYTHPPKCEKFSRLSFYAGSLLDDLNELLYKAKNSPAELIDSHGPASNVTSFMALCKRFMNHFEKVSERRVNRSVLVSGCKAVDVLDCLIEGRQVSSFRVTSGRGNKNRMVIMKLRYMMKRAWFTCLRVPSSGDEESWRDEQRFMYLRLRRLVGSVNEHLFEKLHYERELLLQAPAIPAPRPPPASTYSGYGEYGGLFFYYGNMNKYAYENKFKHVGSTDWERSGNETDGGVGAAPCFDLIINVELRCTPELAPLAVRKILKSDDFDYSSTGTSHDLYLRLCVTCPSSIANRLPGNFTWEIRSPRCRRHSL